MKVHIPNKADLTRNFKTALTYRCVEIKINLVFICIFFYFTHHQLKLMLRENTGSLTSEGLALVVQQ